MASPAARRRAARNRLMITARPFVRRQVVENREIAAPAARPAATSGGTRAASSPRRVRTAAPRGTCRSPLRIQLRLRPRLGVAHVRLVERIQFEHGTGHGRRKFPPEELRAQIERPMSRCGTQDGPRVSRSRASVRDRPLGAGRARRRTLDPRRILGRGRQARRRSGKMPRPCLPVLSATSCSIHGAERLERRARASSVSLSRPPAACCAMNAPSARPGFASASSATPVGHVLRAPTELVRCRCPRGRPAPGRTATAPNSGHRCPAG